MPEGGRERYKSHKLSTMIARLFSFFKFKSEHNHNHTHNNSLDASSEVDNSWFKFQLLKAEDIMIPRADIAAIDYKSSLDDISRVFLECRHTRMPVYKEELDNIIGFINIKDILPYLLIPKDNPVFKIDAVLRKLLIIAPSMKIYDLLEEMRQTRTHIALVVDEMGGIDGLITIEDLVEEIVGEIEDEHDQGDEGLEFKVIDEENFEVSGRIEVEDLEEKLGLKLGEENEEYYTLGGLILSISGTIPNKGDSIAHPSAGVVFKILDSDPRRIKKVLIYKGSSSVNQQQ